ncbi:MAG: aldo/keto reductase, partial [Ilumatobacteraceae bacterium]
MQYRRLGATGVKVSVLSFGSWVTFDNQLDTDLALECMQAAHDAGCNFFDNAESYAAGRSEEIMGRALRELGWPRWSYLVTTKLFWGIHGDDPNMRNTLNRKYLSQAIDASLDRFGLDFIDVVYCHRADPDTPLEETVWAMSDMVSQGKALYWGTSEWSADEIRSAITIADRHYEAALGSVDFIQRYIFPGGFIPSVAAMTDAVARVTDLTMVDLRDIG